MRCRIRSILSDTLAPPRTATYGFSGWSRRRDRDAISASISRPAVGRGRCRVIPTTEACARGAGPKASFTYRSASAASFREKASAFFSSSGWERTVSSTSDSPPRTTTRRPSTSRSRPDSLRVFTSASARGTGGPQVTDEVGQTVHVPPLVVVPCEDLQEIPAVDGQERPVDDRRTAVAQIIDRNQ